MKRRAPGQRSKAQDAARARRRADKEALDALVAAAKAQALPPARRGRHAVLQQFGVSVDAGGAVLLGDVAPAWRGGPLQMHLGPALPKPHRVVSPTWLSLVRMMPCSLCGQGRRFYEQLQLDVSQSEANHYPSRGATAGGSDFETHPVCRACHQDITTHQVLDGDLAFAVGETIYNVLMAVRNGRLQVGVLLACALEAVLGD